ncbi:MAG: hypothetical protein RL088_146 [Verrucomicrobiota bacterium]
MLVKSTMLPEKPATEPRRKWHLLRWTFVLLALVGGWVVWKQYDFQKAVKEANGRGWQLTYSDSFEKIGVNWRAALRKDTSHNTGRALDIPTGVISERDFDLIRRLKPKQLFINATFPWRDMSQLEGLSNLTALVLHDCPNLTNIDALKDMRELTVLGIYDSLSLVDIDALKELKNLKSLRLDGCKALTNVDALRELKALKALNLSECTGLKNVDGLHGLTGLEMLDFSGCTGLTKNAVDGVKSALPKTTFGAFPKK